ncbi:unnamed protein product [Amaranthus hypochondriacus]
MGTIFSPTLKASESSQAMTSQPSHPPKSKVVAFIIKTIEDTILPQSSRKAPQESRITSHVRKTTTSRLQSPPSTSPAQSMSSSYVRKTTTSWVPSPPSLNLSSPPSPTQGMPTNHDENERSNEDEDSNIEPSRSTIISKSKASKPRHRLFIKNCPQLFLLMKWKVLRQ